MIAQSKSNSAMGRTCSYTDVLSNEFKSGPVDRTGSRVEYCRMSEIIFPRSPRETMSGWVYLPRFIDKIRLHLAGRLHSDYQENFTKGFDGVWLKAAGVSAEQFIAVIKNSVTDGQVA